MTDDVLMPFALNADNEIVTVYDVDRGDDCNCTCISCGSPLQARKGKKRIAHFAHRTNVDSTDSTECEFSPITAMTLLLKQEFTRLPRIKLHGAGVNVDDWIINQNSNRHDFDAVAVTQTSRVGFYFPFAGGLKAIDVVDVNAVDSAFEIDARRVFNRVTREQNTTMSRQYIMRAVLYNWDYFVLPIEPAPATVTDFKPVDKSAIEPLVTTVTPIPAPQPSLKSKVVDNAVVSDRLCVCCKTEPATMARNTFCKTCVKHHVGHNYPSLQDMFKAFTGRYS
ncbi:competence protein CoiA family protein [Vibrio mediterranei]|uniref:competence protein CoiA family protein n=1 Tax=Vibrio mediterranei TaxID=689 RepID=UPI0040678898